MKWNETSATQCHIHEICWLLFVVRHWKIECFKTWSKLLVANLRRNIKSSWFVVIHVISWFGWYQTITSTKSHSHLWWRFNLLSFFFIHFNPLWQQCLQTFAVSWWNFHQCCNSLRQNVFSTIYFEFAIFQRRLFGIFHHWNCKCLASLFNKFGVVYLRIDCEVLFIAKWLIAFVY